MGEKIEFCEEILPLLCFGFEFYVKSLNFHPLMCPKWLGWLGMGFQIDFGVLEAGRIERRSWI